MGNSRTPTSLPNIDRDTPVGGIPSPHGYENSHAIPWDVRNHEFYGEISQAVDQNGRQIFDIDNAWNNGQPLPNNNDGLMGVTHSYEEAAQHRGPHPRVTEHVESIFDTWQDQLENDLVARPWDEANIRATYAQKAQDLADLVRMLSIGGMVDPAHPEYRLIYNNSDPNARVRWGDEWDDFSDATKKDVPGGKHR